MSKGKMGLGERGHGGLGGPREMGEGGHAGKPAADKEVSFTFSEDSSTVLALTRTNSLGSMSRTLDSTDSTFITTLGTNDLGNTAVVAVTETRTSDNAVMTRVFTDQDGDASYVPAFSMRVATITDSKHPQHQFTFGSDGTIATDTLVSLRGTRVETIDANEVYAQTILGDATYVTKTTKTDLGYHFDIFRDDNADGNWTSIARGQSSSENIDSTTGAITLTGIQSLLTAADAVIG